MTKYVSTLESYEKEGDGGIRKRSKHYIFINYQREIKNLICGLCQMLREDCDKILNIKWRKLLKTHFGGR